MAMSAVLQFDCSVDNEIARNATKSFAGMLEKAFEQYKKLWNEYLKLRKYCEDSNLKIPFQLDDYNNKDVNTLSEECGCSIESPDVSQILPESIKIPISVCPSVPITCSSGIVSDLDDNSVSRQTNQDKLQSSPILIKKRCKSKNNNNIFSHSSSNESNENLAQQCVPIKEDLSDLANSSQQDELFVEPKQDECSLFSPTEIQCTPVAKVSRKLGVSKQYNVDTTLLKSGKKVKQSKLVFLPCEQSDNRSTYTLLTPEKSKKNESKNRNKSVDEEIIQVSPNKHTESNLRIKNLKIKRKTPIKVIQKGAKDSSILSRNNPDKSNDVKSPLKEKNQLSLTQNFLSTCSFKQENELPSIKKMKTFSFQNDEKTKSKCDIRSPLSVVDKLEHMHFVNDENLSTTITNSEELESIQNINQIKKEYLQPIDEKVHINSSTCDDETFCMLGEKLKEAPAVCNIDKSQITKENIFNNKSQTPSPVRRSLLTSFDTNRKRKNAEVNQPSKKKADRAKMSGVSCWECQRYYANLGLSEEEIKLRQNQCSRHRTNEKKREDTPEGFWNPLFSGTYTSTLQDD
ncbi:uncharacterized protein LOC100876052 isoform X1 [Megachile rotundata]|uniref:uncharacterized protein LOC100876052 isoform X1 n=1 Tax=Megachile rotundata TaxID=143995 RepID=UPI003FD1E3FA